jgi:transaldolase/glucose-6-phosphate isomerase
MRSLDVDAKRARLQQSLHVAPGSLGDAFARAADPAQQAATALWRRDPSAWSDDPAVQATIANRLGWMTSPALMAEQLDRLLTFGARVKDDGFSDVVLLGMGGSSLAPEVLHAILGEGPERPRFRMLDSTDPANVLAAETPPDRTLYIIASKSGTTIEPNALAAHFRARLKDARIARINDHFVAITDDGTELAARARAEGFRDLFINPSDIGGRYSALSYFGMMPAALMAINVPGLIGWALAMLAAAEPGFGTPLQNPAVGLGLTIGAAAKAGRDKLTLIVPPALEPFGLWVEQLIAESTGKHGTGVVPIAGETVSDPSVYGTDRLFVRLRQRGSYAEEMRDTYVRDLKAAGAPVVEIDLPEPSALAAEFVRWEIATAIAGALLRINPFDEPNVQQAKDATKALLEKYKSDGALPSSAPDKTIAPGVTLTLTSQARAALHGQGPDALLNLIGAGDYFALLAYLPYGTELATEMQTFRRAVRDRTHAATMFGYGPRYLHSTGQLHKGGPNTGVFVILTATPRQDVAIPGQMFSFGTLELAQALGDFASLDAAHRRAIHIHLPAPDRTFVRQVGDALLARLRG